ncbi:hypothetical protein [Pantoea sp. CTOTU46764]|uniref:hypothetical protein n=1 Tax=Pantoea sp. CTOTU46764 TaxID=2953854 RepID=UPI0028A2B0F7|nr:hypothetical protein [Pantoea sp. CTOTU46764]
MAMKKCRECDGKVSSSAKTCPHCGVSKPYTSPSGCLIFILAVAFATYMTYFNDEKKTPENSYEKVEDTQEVRSEAQAVIQSRGFTCTKVNSTHAAAFGGSVTVFCDDIYEYKIKDNGGKYQVTAE